MVNNLLISAKDLHKSFGDLHAVDGVSLQIKAGEIYGLVGADGAGKTTTMRLLVGALLLDKGNVTICGYDIVRQTEHARSQIGYLSQRFSMYEDLTVLENIRFFAEVRGLKSDEWLPSSMEILDFVGLEQFKDRRKSLGLPPRSLRGRVSYCSTSPLQVLTLSHARIFGN
jgi:ABC-2 type transport system ATP-binding protein